MIDDVEFLIYMLHNQAPTNQLLILYDDKVFKVDRLDYFPDNDGKVVIKPLRSWTEGSYSVSELLEFLEKYGDKIKSIYFEAEGEEHEVVNVSETCDISGTVFYCNIIVGVSGEPMKMAPGYSQKIINPYVPIIM